jgi:RHS repeat-associated protein
MLQCMDYLPFGEEIARTDCGAVGRGPSRKFTGKERDGETASSAAQGMDYFGARYYWGTLGRFASPDRVNLTDKRLLRPSSTLNKYVYAANNPLTYVDTNGDDITLFYRRGLDQGHVLLVAVNQATGAAAALDYYPDTGDKGKALLFARYRPGPMDVYPDRLREHASLTIQTTPDEAQRVIDFLRRFRENPPTFQVPTSDCATACQEALRLIGIDLDVWTPDALWANLYAMYSADALRARKKLGNPYFAPIGSLPAQPGHEYGNPRYSGAGFDYTKFLSDLLWYQSMNRPVKACVTVQGPKGPETNCDQ